MGVGEALIRYTDVEIHQQELCVLNDVNLELHKGEFVYLVGKSGLRQDGACSRLSMANWILHRARLKYWGMTCSILSVSTSRSCAVSWESYSRTSSC